MRLGICGKATRAVRNCISKVKSLTKVRIYHRLFFLNEQLRVRYVQGGSWPSSLCFVNALCSLKQQLYPPQQEQRDNWASQSHCNKTKQKKQPINRFCGNNVLMPLCLWYVSSHLLSPRSSPRWMTKKKSPFLISSDRAWPRLRQEDWLGHREVYRRRRESWWRWKGETGALGPNR